MIPSPLAKDIRQAAALIKETPNCVALTGAGSSTPSGIPDFRSAGSGLWTRYLPMEVASLTTFRHHPERFFEWLRPLASHMLQAQPNPAHIALAELENQGLLKTIITQNIDGLHQRAGSKSVLEVHGTLNTLSCAGCYKQYRSDPYLDPYLEFGEIPFCPTCGGTLKPDVVLFEEQLPIKTWLAAKKAAESCDLMLITGSSLAVMPVAGLPATALQHGAKVIIINQSATYIDDQAAVVLTGDIADILPTIVNQLIDD
ncbi:MAG: NAD-dependent deacylase [Chloroflexota bacterium]